MLEVQLHSLFIRIVVPFQASVRSLWPFIEYVIHLPATRRTPRVRGNDLTIHKTQYNRTSQYQEALRRRRGGECVVASWLVWFDSFFIHINISYRSTVQCKYAFT